MQHFQRRWQYGRGTSTSSYVGVRLSVRTATTLGQAPRSFISDSSQLGKCPRLYRPVAKTTLSACKMGSIYAPSFSSQCLETYLVVCLLSAFPNWERKSSFESHAF